MTLERTLLRLRAEIRLSSIAAGRGFVRLITGNDLTHAAAIAYYALLSLFPFLLLVISVLGAVTASDEARNSVLNFVFRYFPARLDFVTTQLDAFRETRVPVSIAGLLALMWTSLGVFGAITAAVNEAWGVEKPRSFLKSRLVSFVMLIAAGTVMTVGLLLVSAVQVVEASWFGTILARFAWLGALQTVSRHLATILLILGLGLVFYFIPNAKTRFRDVWVGAILTGLLWQGTFWVFAWYIRTNSRLTMIHGSIATVVVFLLWIYVCSVILMYGVEFTAAHARLRRRRPDDMPAAPALER